MIVPFYLTASFVHRGSWFSLSDNGQRRRRSFLISSDIRKTRCSWNNFVLLPQNTIRKFKCMNNFFWFVIRIVNEISYFYKKQNLMPISATILIALKWRQTSAKIFKQKNCFRVMRYWYKAKIDTDDAIVSFLCRAMRCTFFFLLETIFLWSRLELLRKPSISYVVSQVKSCSKAWKQLDHITKVLW